MGIFKGGAWVAAVNPAEGVSAIPMEDLKKLLMKINDLDVPFKVVEKDSNRYGVEWKIDKKWQGILQSQQVKILYHLDMKLSDRRKSVSVIESKRKVMLERGILRLKAGFEIFRGITFKSYEKEAVYGLPELYKTKIKQAEIIANPGCYPTSVILGCAPLLVQKLVNTDSIIADSKSGYSGAGRQFVLNEENRINFKAYSVGIHRHMPEIEQELSKLAQRKITLSFTPHLIPVERGILSTIYLSLKENVSLEEIIEMFKSFYHQQPFVRVLNPGQLSEVKNVVLTNYCEISAVLNKRTKQIIVISVIDNLVKGASGQAVQNMNLMCGFEETAGLI